MIPLHNINLTVYISQDGITNRLLQNAYKPLVSANSYKSIVYPHKQNYIMANFRLKYFFSFVTEPSTEILGGPDVYIDKGSTINLTCVISYSPEPPAYILWNHNDAVSKVQMSDYVIEQVMFWEMNWKNFTFYMISVSAV